ncbi:serine hydrolase [Pedobacter sp. HMF7056]|uniref:Serine hydrolase n=2 Tax=Hufsiella ginkgonis TaxID=2695274 RepID=A0A7K1XTD3_9SPHI|nr:serine hydrolase [Hufsiella ginkgonis]
MIISALLLCTTLAQAQDTHTAIDSLIARTHRLGLFNGSILVINHGKEVYRKAIGYADASRKTPLTDQYRFHIGSIAKEFNATAVMMLKEQGKLSVNDPVSKYLPDLPAWAQTIRVKNLLQYTSGLPDLKWKTISNDREALDSLKSIPRLDFEPGTQYAYNNSNTLLQRLIVEKISGMTFRSFVTQKMLKPLKMNASIVDPDDNTPLMAKSYTDAFVQSPLTSPISGWTAVTPGDFYKWERALENFTLINPASTREILTPFAPRKQCGLGGGEMDGDKLATHTHDGTSLNYQALLTADARSGRTMILMTNNKQNNLYDISNAILNILDGKPYQQPKKVVLTALQDKIDTAPGAEILAAYRELKTSHPNEYNFESESTLNTIGYVLLNKKRFDDAILVFSYNTTLFPKSGNVFDSLAEAWYRKGDKANALLNYRRSLELDPANAAAKEKIAGLQKPD